MHTNTHLESPLSPRTIPDPSIYQQHGVEYRKAHRDTSFITLAAPCPHEERTFTPLLTRTVLLHTSPRTEEHPSEYTGFAHYFRFRWS